MLLFLRQCAWMDGCWLMYSGSS